MQTDWLTSAKHPLISTQVLLALETRLYELISKANNCFKIEFPYPQINFKLRGKVAGKAYLQAWEIRLNPKLLIENQEAFIDDVLAHELAHLIVYHRFIQPHLTAKSRPNIKPHGREWCAVMEKVFQRPAQVTHSFDVTSVQGPVFSYKCHCSNHELTKRRHLKVQREQTRYLCRKCNQSLVFTPEF